MLQQWAAARELYELGIADIGLIARCLGQPIDTVRKQAKSKYWKQSDSVRLHLSDSINKLSNLLSDEITDLSLRLDHEGFNEEAAKQLASLTKFLETIAKLAKETGHSGQKSGNFSHEDESIVEFRERLEKQIEIITDTKPAQAFSEYVKPG